MTADVVGLYPSISHGEGLNILTNKKVSREYIGKMAGFVL